MINQSQAFGSVLNIFVEEKCISFGHRKFDNIVKLEYSGGRAIFLLK